MPGQAQPQSRTDSRYNLGPVKPWVSAAADWFGTRHGIADVGGWREHGSVPNSDHPKGRALDFMTRSKSRGDALAADLIKNHQKWNVSYVIWYRRVWSPGRGWRPYSGPSPHTDHVHASFGDKAGAGEPGAPSKLPGIVDKLSPAGLVDAVTGVRDQLAGIGETAASIAKVADLVVSMALPQNIVRGAAGLAGTVFVLIGIWFLSREVRSS